MKFSRFTINYCHHFFCCPLKYAAESDFCSPSELLGLLELPVPTSVFITLLTDLSSVFPYFS